MQFYGVVRDFGGGPETVVPVGLGGAASDSVWFGVSNSRFVLPCPALPRTPFTVTAPDSSCIRRLASGGNLGGELLSKMGQIRAKRVAHQKR